MAHLKATFSVLGAFIALHIVNGMSRLLVAHLLTGADMKKLLTLCAAAATLAAVPVSAKLLTYTMSGLFTGSIGASNFMAAPLTLVGVGNTLGATDYGSFTLVPLSSLTITDGSTTATLEPGLFFGVNQALHDVFFVKVIDLATNVYEFPLAINDPSFMTYDGLTETTTPAVGVLSNPFLTSSGLITFVDASDVTFSAVAVPEPATWALTIVGFAMVGVSMRHRPRKVLATAV